MKEWSIIFSGESVRAILAGRKTQTRRVVKPAARVRMIDEIYQKMGRVELHLWEGDVFCPYGDPGDRVWVRETWAHDDLNCLDVRCGNRDHIWWRANETPIVADSFAGAAHWRSSIHMPRWASRISLEIMSVRVERLQEISEADAEAEGIHLSGLPVEERYNHPRKHIIAFAELWDLINAKSGHPWESNPWVWVITFRKMEHGT